MVRSALAKAVRRMGQLKKLWISLRSTNPPAGGVRIYERRAISSFFVVMVILYFLRKRRGNFLWIEWESKC